MTDKLKAILINPHDKTITAVEVDPYPAWKELIEVELITSVNVLQYPNGAFETVYIDDEGLLNSKKDGPFFSIASHPQPLAGKGLVIGVNERGDTVSTKLTPEFITELVDFPRVKFDGFTEIEPHTEKHPIFGEVSVVGQRAHFSSVYDDTDTNGVDEKKGE